MRRATLALAVGAAACGSPKPKPDFGPTVSPVAKTRVPIEDTVADDDIEVIRTVGHVEPEAVNAGLAPHRTALVSCYTERLGRRPWLGGHAMLRWVITAEGVVTRVVIVESDLGAWPIEKCLLDVARGISFGKPVGGPAELTLPLTFDAPSSPEVWDVIASAKALGGELDALAACSEGAKQPPVAKPKAKGKPKQAKPAKDEPPALNPTVRSRPPSEVTLTLYMHGSGRVESVGFASATGTLEDAWAACAEQRILEWALPGHKGQVVKLGVRYRPR